jgi:nitrous oxide reductase accessory protein NosL
MDFLNQMLGAQRAYARAQLGVSKICLEQQLYRNLMCSMCGMNGSSCYCGPCGGSSGSATASGCCVIDSCNVTHETITPDQAKKTILLYLASEEGKSITTEAKLQELIDEGKNESAAKSEWQTGLVGTSAAPPKDLLEKITKGVKRFAVFLIAKKDATFVQ